MPKNNSLIKPDRRRKSVLIVECDSNKLTSQNLAIGKSIYQSIQDIFPKNPILFLQINEVLELSEKLAIAKQNNQKFRHIIIIGHSNKNGLALTSNCFSGWEAIGRWFELFSPVQIIFLACEAGNWQACVTLFESIPTLKEIFASPVTADLSQQYAVIMKTVFALEPPKGKKVSSLIVKLMQVVNFSFTKGIFFHYTRDEYERSTHRDMQLWTGFESTLSDFMKLIRGY